MVRYRLLLDNGTSFDFIVDRNRAARHVNDSSPHADWTLLNYHRCPDCPLAGTRCLYCPAALDIEEIATKFQAIASTEKARVEVTTPERTYLKDCDVQTALCSLMGLVMATSGCPVFAELKPLAATHLPFATTEETLLRTVGAHLLKQYFVHKAGGTPDIELLELAKFYKQLQSVDRFFHKRLEAAQDRDANLNAMVSLSLLSVAVSISLEEHLVNVREMYCPE